MKSIPELKIIHERFTESKARFHDLVWAFHDAQTAGHTSELATIHLQLKTVEILLWNLTGDIFPDVAGYSTLLDALQQTAARLNIPFPNVTDPAVSSEIFYFKAYIGLGVRAVNVYLVENTGVYQIDVYDPVETFVTDGICYNGKTPHFNEVVRVFSEWLIGGVSIEILNRQHHWVSTQPITTFFQF